MGPEGLEGRDMKKSTGVPRHYKQKITTPKGSSGPDLGKGVHEWPDLEKKCLVLTKKKVANNFELRA